MSPAMLAWSAVWTLAALAACVTLLRASGQPGPSARSGYRWLAAAAASLAVGGILQQALGGLTGGAQPLRLADLVSLAALPAIVLGVATLTAGHQAAAEGAGQGADRLLREPELAAPANPPPGIALDSCLLVCSLFAICLVTMFGPDYATADAGRAAFALALIRPGADLIALGMLLRYAVRGPRVSFLPMAALAVLAVGDSLAVSDRIAGAVPGTGPRVALVAALVLLATASSPVRAPSRLAGPQRTGSDLGERRRAHSAASWSSPATMAALAAAAAALVATGFSLSGSPVSTPVLAITESAVVLLLVARLAGLARQTSAVAASAHEYDWMFRALADTTSDAVLICDLAGTIEYASAGVAEFGYLPGDLARKRLADLVHPEDRPAGIRAAITALRAEAGTGDFAGRIRGADGSWRYVESTLSRYGEAGAPARLLITSRDVSDLIALRRQVTQLTFHDGLTGLPNRAYVEEHVRQISQEQREAGQTRAAGSRPAAAEPAGPGLLVAAIRVDLDDFAAVNEVAGSAGADLLLAQAARRLRAAVPPPDTVARWGSDEFAILVWNAPGEREVVDLAEQVAGQIAAEPFTVAGKEFTVTASVGVAVGGIDAADHVIGRAGMALARVKEAGPGRVGVFTAEMHAQAQHRAELAGELRQAIAEHRLRIQYQPIVELTTSLVRQVEALAGWPQAGPAVGSAEIGGIAEDSGLVVRLGSWTLRKACQQAAAWRADGWDVGVAVRCAFRQVTAPGFVASVLAALEVADLPPQALTLEVAERVLIDAAAPVAADLAGLRGKGIRLAIDSFGTEYASLTCLRRAAVDAVKLDPSLVAGLRSDPAVALLTRSIIGIGAELGIDVIAAGIETPQQRELLEAMGCGLGQGPGIAALLPSGFPTHWREDRVGTGSSAWRPDR